MQLSDLKSKEERMIDPLDGQRDEHDDRPDEEFASANNTEQDLLGKRLEVDDPELNLGVASRKFAS